MAALRIISWNLRLRVGRAAARQAALIADLSPHIACLQEVNSTSIPTLELESGLEWLTGTVPSESPSSRRSAFHAIVAGGLRTTGTQLPRLDVPFPDRTASAVVTVGAAELTVASYHAPPGASWGILKVRQALTFAEWLTAVSGPAILGADANTPKIDAIDFEQTQTHWHTGDRRLNGLRGDDALWGPGKVHQLRDALRAWLDNHPDHLAEIRRQRPLGPLEVSHRTGARRGHPGNPRRFDSIWISDHWLVKDVRYLYDEGVAAGSDHALVVADLTLK